MAYDAVDEKSHAAFDAADHICYLENVVYKIDGWLLDYAALTTMRLLDYQHDIGAKGCLVEIGVYKGKYFSVLLRSGTLNKEDVFGIDTFFYSSELELKANLNRYTPECRFTIIPVSSRTFIARELLSTFGGNNARFFSIDGSHESDDVLWDLRLAEDLISAEGVISVDDFMNYTAIGVNEGVHRFFSLQRNVVPFAMLANKLFLCRPHMANNYKCALERFADADQGQPLSTSFAQRRAKGREHVEQPLWGSKILTFF
jgi:Methyltransferase domain